MSLFFDYSLPPELIAQEPAASRDAARLLVVDRRAGTLAHRTFRDLPELLNPGDRLVLNDTRVVPARLVGRRARTGGKWEGLFLREPEAGVWELLAQTRGYVEVGETIEVEPGPLTLELLGRTAERHWLVRPSVAVPAAEVLARHGNIPLPPYIRKGRGGAADAERYQTVYAARLGSVAAPTAGLHFTPELLAALAARGVARSAVTLHVGLGTFAPVKGDDPTQHRIHEEWCEVSEEVAADVRATRSAGGRVVAVGTTSVRTLESSARGGAAASYRGDTGLFIHPPFEFRAVDAVVTNFHLPRTTLLLLVQAFSGSDLLRRAYDEAVRERYRFYSYGDGMLIL